MILKLITLEVHTVFKSKIQWTGGPFYYVEKKDISLQLICMVNLAICELLIYGCNLNS